MKQTDFFFRNGNPKKGAHMTSKKMWMTLGILIGFLGLSAVIAAGVSRLPVQWGAPFGIGAALMAAAIVPVFFAEKHPWAPVVTLCLNVLSCGLLVGSFYVAKSLPLPFTSALLYALAAAGSYLVPMLLLSIPGIARHTAPFVIVCFLWIIALFTAGVALWIQLGEKYAAFTLFCIPVALFAIGSFTDCDTPEKLLVALAVPSSFAVGIIAVIVLLVLLQADSCDCDCCDGGCCDCSSDFGSGTGKKKKPTTMSGLSGNDFLSE